MSRRSGILLVLDGWGEAPPADDNAIDAAHTPTLDRLRAECGRVLLDASGTSVGLPDGVVGNSEIGHLVIGAGRPLEYDSLLVQREVDARRLRRHPELVRLCDDLAGRGAALHLVGLCSDGRIHADIAHTGELLAAAAASGLTSVWLHAVADGRDVANGTAPAYLRTLRAMTASAGIGRIASVIGRNYAMDKAGNADLTEVACDLVLDAIAKVTVVDGDEPAVDGTAIDDGWIPATAVTHDADPPPPVRDGDAVLFTNFRSDRIAPLVDMIGDRLAESGRTRVSLVSLAQYDTRHQVTPLIRRADASGGLGDVLEAHGMVSVRIAEREKFEHVTFYLNGRDHRIRAGEERFCVPTVAGAEYVERPEMNVEGVAAAVVEAARRTDVSLVVANLANIDVVGHTGHFAATVRATEAVDRALRDIVEAARSEGRWALLVGDHGNGEQMTQRGPDGAAKAYGGHTRNHVPCMLVPSPGTDGTLRAGDGSGTLPSVATTVLALLGAEPPPSMTAPSLLASGRSNDG